MYTQHMALHRLELKPMFKKGNKHGCREVKKDQDIRLRVTAQEKESIKQAADGNVSGYLLGLHNAAKSQ